MADRFARVWAYATTPARWGQRDRTALYGFCAWPPTRIAQGPVQMTNPPGPWQAAFPAALPGDRHHRPCRAGGRKRPANPPTAWQLILYVSRARWGVRGCTDIARGSRQFATRMLPIGPPHSTDRIRVRRRAGRERRPDSPVESGRIQAPGRVPLPQDESDESEVCPQVQGCAPGALPAAFWPGRASWGRAATPSLPADIRSRRLNPMARGEGAEHPGKRTNRHPQRSWRPSRERLRVISSAYSRWPPTGSPCARRVRRMPCGLTRRER